MNELKLPHIQTDLCSHSFYWDLLGWLEIENNSVLHRTCSLMRKMEAEAYVLERLEPDEELKREISDLDKSFIIKGATSKGVSQILRLSFFSEPITTRSVKDLDERSCLSSTTVIKYRNGEKRLNYIYETFMCFPHKKDGGSNLLNNYYHTGRSYRVRVLKEKDFFIDGTYFCQQNGRTSVCAHSVLKMIINSAKPTLVSSGIKLTTSIINERLEIDHVKKKADKGLILSDLDEILREYGFKTIVGNFFEKPELDVTQYLYCVIESGYPAFLKFATDTDFHAIAVIGHTLNSDEWYPEATYGYLGPGDILHDSAEKKTFKFHSSSRWVDHFLIHDDNYGMYYCVGAWCLSKITLPKFDPRMRTHSVIGIYPEHLASSPALIEQHAALIINHYIRQIYETESSAWGRKLYEVCSKGSPNEHLVLRTLKITRQSYLQHLKDLVDHKKNGISKETLELAEILPDAFWMTEFTLPNLYTANKSKLGEALLYADNEHPQRLDSLLVAFRGPGRFIISDIDLQSTHVAPAFLIHDNETIVSHCDLFRNEQMQEVSEW